MILLITVFSLTNILFGLAALYVCWCYQEQVRELEKQAWNATHAAGKLDKMKSVGWKIDIDTEHEWIVRAKNLHDPKWVMVSAKTFAEAVEALRVATGTEYSWTESWTCKQPNKE